MSDYYGGKRSYRVEYTADKEKNPEGNTIEADMPKEQAIAMVVNTIEEQFGTVKVDKITDLQMTDYSYIAIDEAKEYVVREYFGVVECKDGNGYEFCIDSITGQIYEIQQLNNRYEKYRYTGDEIEKMIEKNPGHYRDIAVDFIRNKLGEKEVIKNKITMSSGSSAGTAGSYDWERDGIVVDCRCENGNVYNIWIDPDTEEND